MSSRLLILLVCPALALAVHFAVDAPGGIPLVAGPDPAPAPAGVTGADRRIKLSPAASEQLTELSRLHGRGRPATRRARRRTLRGASRVAPRRPPPPADTSRPPPPDTTRPSLGSGPGEGRAPEAAVPRRPAPRPPSSAPRPSRGRGTGGGTFDDSG